MMSFVTISIYVRAQNSNSELSEVQNSGLCDISIGLK